MFETIGEGESFLEASLLQQVSAKILLIFFSLELFFPIQINRFIDMTLTDMLTLCILFGTV